MIDLSILGTLATNCYWWLVSPYIADILRQQLPDIRQLKRRRHYAQIATQTSMMYTLLLDGLCSQALVLGQLLVALELLSQ